MDQFWTQSCYGNIPLPSAQNVSPYKLLFQKYKQISNSLVALISSSDNTCSKTLMVFWNWIVCINNSWATILVWERMKIHRQQNSLLARPHSWRKWSGDYWVMSWLCQVCSINSEQKLITYQPDVGLLHWLTHTPTWTISLAGPNQDCWLRTTKKLLNNHQTLFLVRGWNLGMVRATELIKRYCSYSY